MSRISVPQAADRLAVSPARVRQRIESGELVAEKIGGRWLVDLDASPPAPAEVGRPVNPLSVWWSISEVQQPHAVEPISDRLAAAARQLSRSSRNRAMHRMANAVQDRDHQALLVWLRNRASRHLYMAAPADLAHLRADKRLAISGVSHPESGIEDPRIAEGYVDAGDLDAVVNDYWLERPRVGELPNVVLHATPVRPSAVEALLLAADLSEHQEPREIARAHVLLERWLDARSPSDDESGVPA
jgi:hypothetical protein